jgi:hypothetical protein
VGVLHQRAAGSDRARPSEERSRKPKPKREAPRFHRRRARDRWVGRAGLRPHRVVGARVGESRHHRGARRRLREPRGLRALGSADQPPDASLFPCSGPPTSQARTPSPSFSTVLWRASSSSCLWI